MNDIVVGILNKSLKLEDISEDMLEEVIQELSKTKEDLNKQFGLINALQDKGLPWSSSSGTGVNTTQTPSTPTPTTDSGSASDPSPSIAEQINFGGKFGKQEKVKYFKNGQWDIQPIQKDDESDEIARLKHAVKYARTKQAMPKLPKGKQEMTLKEIKQEAERLINEKKKERSDKLAANEDGE
jgi:hypothetical protein